MAGRTTRRVPAELKAVQDERLTCRHIKALMQLQQVTDENQELKSKLQALTVCFYQFTLTSSPNRLLWVYD